jgi:hypothetical protein
MPANPDSNLHTSLIAVANADPYALALPTQAWQDLVNHAILASSTTSLVIAPTSTSSEASRSLKLLKFIKTLLNLSAVPSPSTPYNSANPLVPSSHQELPTSMSLSFLAGQ